MDSVVFVFETTPLFAASFLRLLFRLFALLAELGDCVDWMLGDSMLLLVPSSALVRDEEPAFGTPSVVVRLDEDALVLVLELGAMFLSSAAQEIMLSSAEDITAEETALVDVGVTGAVVVGVDILCAPIRVIFS